MIDPILRDAYLATRYVVMLDGRELALKIGEPSPELDRIMTARAVTMAAFVTAWNPCSERLPVAENLARSEALAAAVRDTGLETLPVVAGADDPDWTEHGLLILGADATLASRLGRRFAQNAVVTVARGEAPQLVVLVSPDAAS
jgi:Protein of unknown function (DUF3293)